MRRLFLAIWLLLGLARISSADSWDTESTLEKISTIRDSLLKGEVQTRWLPAKQEEEFLDRFRTNGDSNIDDSFFSDPPRIARFDRFSEWPGDWLGFSEVLTNSDLLNKISDFASTLHNVEVDKSSVLQIIDLQHDFLELYELLEVWSSSKPYDENRKERLQEDVKLILRSLLLKKEQTQNLMPFDPTAFCREKSEDLKVYKIETKVLRHDTVSNFRIRSEIYLIEGGFTPFKNWMTVPHKITKSKASAMLVLAEYPLCFFDDGRAEYIPVPKTVRFEDIGFVSDEVRSKAFSVYRFDAAQKNGVPIYRRLAEDSGGTPMEELPNVSNGRRAQLSISCINCHGGGMMLATEPPRMLNEVKKGDNNLFSKSTVQAELETKMKMSLTKKLMEFLKASQ